MVDKQVKSKDLAKAIGITEQNLSILKNEKLWKLNSYTYRSNKKWKNYKEWLNYINVYKWLLCLIFPYEVISTSNSIYVENLQLLMGNTIIYLITENFQKK